MRNNLTELPVLLACLRGGLCAGGAAYLIRLPKRLYSARHRGLRTPWTAAFLFALLDILTCVSVALVFASSIVYANGGELRLYAVSGFFIALAAAVKLLKNVFW